MKTGAFMLSARASVRTLVAMLIMVAAEGCEKAKELTASLEGAGAVGAGPAVPSEIADACLALFSLGSEMHFENGHRLAEIIPVVSTLTDPEGPSWEKSSKGYIWSWTRRDDLEQVETQYRFEFAILPARENPPYQGDDCGPRLVRLEGGAADGKRLQELTVATIFRRAVELLEKQQEAGKTAVSTQGSQSLGNEPANHADAAGFTTTPESAQFQGSQGTVTDQWLFGTWGPASNNPSNNPMASCDTDSVVTYMSDGTYRDGGSYGRFRTDGRTVTYFNRVLFDLAEETEDRSQFDKPLTTNVARIEANTLREDGALYRRCRPD